MGIHERKDHLEPEKEQITLALPGCSPTSYPKGILLYEVLHANGLLASGHTIAGQLNGQAVDLATPLIENGDLAPIDLMSEHGLEIYRHSTSHVMAYAVQELFDKVRIAIGPSIENGFYYDFDYHQPFTPEDLDHIELRMREIINKDEPFSRKVMSKEQARVVFLQRGEVYKLELLDEIPGDTVSLYDVGNFVDLCRGPHLPSTGLIKAFKLTGVAGAYWRGDERKPMLQRIYGTAFPTQEALESHLNVLEEGKKRDHRRLGRELDLFSISEEIGAGLVCWHPRGARVRTIIEDFWRQEHYKNGYDLLYTPHLAKLHLWETSGHTDFYIQNMFSPMDVEGQKYLIKPMNCPFHIQVFKSRIHSYRDLPKRWAELGTVYRYERSGVLHGLLRVRGFTQDDAHIFCRLDQLESEIENVITFTLFILKTFGFSSFKTFVSTRPEKYVGAPESWDRATRALESALEKVGLEYAIDPGEGVFYGPKIDIKITDSLGRQWQCSTIQVDFNLPDRFGLSYVGEDGLRHPVIMIHRALMGSLERFLGCLIEHYNGAFPVWLAPEQVMLLPITDRVHGYAREVLSAMRNKGIRVEGDWRNEKLGFKIREAQLMKIPYMVILGDKEAENKMLSIRCRTGETYQGMPLEEFLTRVHEETVDKRSGTG